jgi:hypothetical protein
LVGQALPPALKFLLAAALLTPTPLIAQSPSPWRPLFDGKSLAGWKESDFLGAGKVTVDKGIITIGSGVLTGITWAGDSSPVPAIDYEVRVEASRVKGSDFFAGITFPVRDSFCTWILGGWAGEVVGLSSIDGADASQNETTFSRKFEPGHWYSLRLRVTAARIMTWIDEEPVIDVSIVNRWVALREGDIDRSIPFGIATFATVGAVRRIEWRPLKP